MHIALDAMGGDFGPEELITGAILAIKQAGIKITLVGDASLLQSYVDKHSEGAGCAPFLEIAHASEVVGMERGGRAAGLG